MKPPSFLAPSPVLRNLSSGVRPQPRTVTTSSATVTHALVPTRSRVAVIGFGPAGIQVCLQLRDAGFQPHVFEASDHIGGVWAYSPTFSTTSPVYKSLRCNLPLQVMTFSDIPHPANASCFLSHVDVLHYLRHYVYAHDLMRYVSLNTSVTSIQKVQAEGTWRVDTHSTKDGTVSTDVFHAVVVCTGHFSVPFRWQVDGKSFLDKAGIHTIHSQRYKTPAVYRRKRVLVVGGGPSGVDIALELTTTADHVYFSHTLSPTGNLVKIDAPNNLTETGRATRVMEDGTIETEDGHKFRVDAVVESTGYRKTLPFLEEGTCGVRVWPDGRSVRGLVRHCIAAQDGTLSFIGLLDKMLPFPTFERQAAFITQVLQGVVSKRLLEELYREEFESQMREQVSDKMFQTLGTEAQMKYVNDMSQLCGCEGMSESTMEILTDCKQVRTSNPVNYRRRVYTVTGKMSGNWRYDEGP